MTEIDEKKLEAEWIISENVLGELITRDRNEKTRWKRYHSREAYEEMKDLEPLRGRISWETWKRYWDEVKKKLDEDKTDVEPEINLIWDRDLQDYEIPEKSYWIEGLIPQGSVGVWTGKRGSFKTFLVMNACYGVATGKEFLELGTTKGSVIYLDKENGIPIIKERARMIKEGMKIENSDIAFICFSQLKIDKNTDLWAIDELIEKEKPSLLIIDTYRRAISFDENSAGDTSALFVDGLRPLVEKHYPLSIVLIHHDRKGSGQGDEMDEVRGSSDLVNYADFILKNERRGKNLILKQLKMRNAAEMKPLGVSVETDEKTFIRFKSTGEASSLTKDQKCAEALILWITREKIKTFTTKDALSIAFQSGAGKNKGFEAIASLEDQGIIEKTMRGIYNVVEVSLVSKDCNLKVEEENLKVI